MNSVQGPVVCPTVRAKQVAFCSIPMIGAVKMNVGCMRSEFWGLGGVKAKPGFLSCRINTARCKTVHCSLNSPSNDSGSTAGNFNENDEEYVTSTVIEAVEVKSGADGFIIKMRDGRHVRCVHNNPQGGHLPDYAPHPAIVLKMEDGTGLLLPIIVLEMPSVLLMAAIRNVPIARPTLYQVVKEMIDKMGYEVKLVRVTRRVHEAYFAQLYLTKVGNAAECVSFDLRPSDAINIAIRCKVPIQVNKHLAYSDGMRVIESGKLSTQLPGDGRLFTEMDRKDAGDALSTLPIISRSSTASTAPSAVTATTALSTTPTFTLSTSSNLNLNHVSLPFRKRIPILSLCMVIIIIINNNNNPFLLILRFHKSWSI